MAGEHRFASVFNNAGMQQAALEALATLEALSGQTFNINSAYRDPEHNRNVGGARNSQHTHGNAFDIDVSGMTEEERLALIRMARQAGFGGIGVYNNALHFDVGPVRAWGPNYHADSIPAWAADVVNIPLGGGSLAPTISTSQSDGLRPATVPPVQTNVLNSDGSVGPLQSNALTGAMAAQAVGATPQYNINQNEVPPALASVNYDQMAGVGPLIQPPQPALAQPAGQAPMASLPPQVAAQMQTQGGPMAQQSAPQDRGLSGLFGMSTPARLTPDRQDLLLALGTGILSGDNWSEGLAAAGQNAMAVRAGQKDRDAQLADQQTEQQFALQRMAAQAAMGQQSSPELLIGNYMMRDGSIAGNLAQYNGRILDASGRDITDQVVQRVNNSDAFGSTGQLSMNQWLDQTGTLMSQGSSLRTIDRMLEGLKQIPFGAEGYATDLKANLTTLFGGQIDAEAMQRKILAGDIQGLIGQVREQVVGPGVMTEQDAQRILAAMGGDLSIFSNPQAMIERLTLLRDSQYRTYDQMYSQLDAVRTNFPQPGYVMPERYGAPVLDQSNAGVSALDQVMNDPSLSQYLQ